MSRCKARAWYGPWPSGPSSPPAAATRRTRVAGRRWWCNCGPMVTRSFSRSLLACARCRARAARFSVVHPSWEVEMGLQQMWSRPRTLGTAAALVVVAAASPHAAQQQGQEAARPTPAPGFTVDSAAKEALLRYGQSLAFDTSVTAIDEQYILLPVRGAFTVGPWLRISPEIGAGQLAHAAAASGRIVARASLTGSHGTVTAYWYVDSTSTGWRSIWAVDDPRFALIVDTLTRFHQHPGGYG